MRYLCKKILLIKGMRRKNHMRDLKRLMIVSGQQEKNTKSDKVLIDFEILDYKAWRYSLIID